MAGIFKAYDVRGLYPDELERADRPRGGSGLPATFWTRRTERHGEQRGGEPRHAGHSEPLCEALIEGLLAGGLDVIDIGLATTPMNYFAVGHLQSCRRRPGHRQPQSGARTTV